MAIYLTSPENGSTVSLLTEKHKAFLRRGGNDSSENLQPIDWQNLVKQGEDNTFPAPVAFAWEGGEAAQLFLSQTEDFAACTVFPCKEHALAVENLLAGQTYFWKVVSGGVSSAVFRFCTEAAAPRWIHAEGLSNIRDIGGWQLPEGKIRQGLVFRGSEMEFHHAITEQGRDVLLNTLHIKTDLDLRGEAVGMLTQTALGSGVRWELIPVRAYNEFMLPEEKEAAKRIFKLFAKRENYPFYIHCWGGADRTGTLILMLCAILGMEQRDLFLDYELTSFSIWGLRSAQSELFRALLAELDTYGDQTASINKKCENFLLSAGVTQEDLCAIREILTER